MRFDLIPEQLIIWLIIGFLAGSLAGMFRRYSRKGQGAFTNLVIGFIGIPLGSSLFKLLDIDLELGFLQLPLSTLISTCLGALIFVISLDLIKK